MNDITNANVTDMATRLRAGLANVKSALPSAPGQPFLRMLKDGHWVYGKEDTEVEEGQRFVVNPMNIEHGYIAWLKRAEGSKEPAKVLGERMVPMTENKPDKNALPHVEEGEWTDQVSIPLMGVGGEDDGVELLYKTNSYGGLQACNDLLDAIFQQIGLNPASPFPIVELQNDNYKHKQHGKIYTPVFKVVGWTDGTASGQAAPAKQVEAQQAAAVEQEPEQVAPEPAPSTDEPVRRRRRSA